VADEIASSGNRRILSQSEETSGYCKDCRIKLVAYVGNRKHAVQSLKSSTSLRRGFQVACGIFIGLLMVLRHTTGAKILPWAALVVLLTLWAVWLIVDIAFFGSASVAGQALRKVLVCQSCGAWKSISDR
jgi:hypothetical protein